MTVSLKTMMDKLPPEQRAAIEKRAAELIAQEMALRKLREEFALTQANVAKRMGIGQETVSRIEARQKDLRLSTLRKYIEALGGKLQLVAQFPDRAVTVLDLTPVARSGKPHARPSVRPAGRRRPGKARTSGPAP